MSIRVISRILPKRWGSPSRKIIAIKLADVANDDGSSIYPSVFTVASEAELSERQVQRVMEEFRDAGLLIVVRPGGGRNRPTEYRFNLEAIDRLPDAKPSTEIGEPKAENAIPVNSDMVSPFKAETVTSATGNGDMGVTQPVLTRSIPYGEADASQEAITDKSVGGTPEAKPTTSSLIWKEARALLTQRTNECQEQIGKLVGKWFSHMTTKTALLKTMREKCLDCSCHQPSEVAKCPAQRCVLWPFRFGKDPSPARKLQVKNLAPVGEILESQTPHKLP